MQKNISAQIATKAMIARGWELGETNADALVFTTANGLRAEIRFEEGNPTLVLAADLVKYARGVQLAMSENGEVVLLGGDGGTAVAELDPDIDTHISSPPLAPPRGPGRGKDLCLRVAIRPGDSGQAKVDAVLEAISNLNIALGGHGIDFDRVSRQRGGKS